MSVASRLYYYSCHFLCYCMYMYSTVHILNEVLNMHCSWPPQSKTHSYTHVFMSIFLRKFIRKFIRTQPIQPILLKRHIDDILMIWPANMDIHNFMTTLNNYHPNIKFTYTCSQTSVDFLDVTIYNTQLWPLKCIKNNKTCISASITPQFIPKLSTKDLPLVNAYDHHPSTSNSFYQTSVKFST